MLWQYDPYALPLFFAASASAGLALLMMRRRRLFVRLPGATTFVLLLLMIAEWSLTAGVGYMSADLSSILLWDKLSYVCVAFVPVACAVFCIQYTGRGGWLRTRILVLACFVPVVTLLLDWTNEVHHLIYSEFSLVSFGSLSILDVTYGAWFWVHLAYAYTLILFGIVLLAQQFSRSQGVPRRQSLILILSILVPLVASVFDAFPPFVDYTPLAFTFTGFGCFWAVFRFRLFRIMPIAREAIVRGMGDGVIVLDTENRIMDINPAGEQIFGCAAAESLGKSVDELFKSRGLDEQFLASSSSEITLAMGGVQRYFDVHFSPLHDQRVSLVGQIGVLRDVTERKRMEEELLRSQRMATIGELAAMVGHDIRNPLQGIAIATHYLMTKEGSKLGEKGKEMLQLILEEIRCSDKIINDLLEYSQELHLELSETDAKSIAKDALVHLEIPAEIRVVDSTRNEWKMSLDTGKIRRVFLNLLQNAIDAMPKGGTLTITSKRSNGRVEIAFRDTGVGMTEETMRKLWSPLFTTKAKGMGFGLAISRRVVEAHGGSINVESRPGEGSTFTVILPIRKAKRESVS